MNTFRTILKPILSYPCHLLPGLSTSFFSAHHCTCQDMAGSESNDQENTKGAPITMHDPCLKIESVTLGVRVASQAKMLSETRKNLPSDELPPILQEHSPDSRQDVFQLSCMFEKFHDKVLKNRHQKDKQRRRHCYYDTLEYLNYKINLPVIDFYQRWRP